jgi:hypothetical protein
MLGMELQEIKEFFTAEGKPSSTINFEEPGVLLTTVLGDADEFAAAEYSGYVAHLFESEGLAGMIVDAKEAGTISPEAAILLGRSDALNFVRKVGVYNIPNPIFRASLEAIIKVSGRDNIKIFKSKEEALDYVRS